MNDEHTCPECHDTGLVHADNGVTYMESMCERCDGNVVIEQPTGNEKLTREKLNANNE